MKENYQTHERLITRVEPPYNSPYYGEKLVLPIPVIVPEESWKDAYTIIYYIIRYYAELARNNIKKEEKKRKTL